jgi:hypothetical protein
MKKISVLAFTFLLSASPAFAATQVLQEEVQNAVGNSAASATTDGGNGGVAAVNVSNSAGIVNHNINTGASSNVGSAMDVVISGGASISGDAVTAGGGDGYNNQLAVAQLAQISSGNATGIAAECAATSAYNNGVNNVSVNGSRGVISQQINTGATSNVGSAIGVTTIH